ncbi:MAG: hypothetical protein ACR2L3_05280, partial [Actinomycetota bacterium]
MVLVVLVGKAVEASMSLADRFAAPSFSAEDAVLGGSEAEVASVSADGSVPGSAGCEGAGSEGAGSDVGVASFEGSGVAVGDGEGSGSGRGSTKVPLAWSPAAGRPRPTSSFVASSIP